MHKGFLNAFFNRLFPYFHTDYIETYSNGPHTQILTIDLSSSKQALSHYMNQLWAGTVAHIWATGVNEYEFIRTFVKSHNAVTLSLSKFAIYVSMYGPIISVPFAEHVTLCDENGPFYLPSNPQTPHDPKCTPFANLSSILTHTSCDPSSWESLKVFHYHFPYKSLVKLHALFWYFKNRFSTMSQAGNNCQMLTITELLIQWYQPLPCGARIDTLRPRQDGRHFPDDILKCIFLNENVWISRTISMKCVRKVRINNIPSLVQIMAWRRLGDKPLSEPMMGSILTM